MRALGLDLGAARIGVALSDQSGTLASPAGVIRRSGDTNADHGAVARWVAEHEADVVVVGLPLSLSGRAGPAARAVETEVAALRARLAVPVETNDERLSTVSATRALRAASGGRAVKAARRRTGEVDAAAAAVMLQAWLDRRAHSR